MRPEYADRFDMKNFKRLRAHGTNFAKAYLGYMGSETVISHNVITSGQEPRHMGWVDEAYRDTENLLGGGAGAMWITGNFGLTEFGTLIANEGYPKLADYLHGAFPGTKFIAVGQKSYAIESTSAPSGDIAVRMSSRGAAADCPLLGGAWRSPSGLNVPTYLTEPMCGRFFVNSDSANDYGTATTPPAWMYPEDGNRFFPGIDPAHLGGDVWVADAAMAMMENEDWSGMFLSLGGIDKAGHMWGADQDVQPPPGSIDYQTHVPFNAKTADKQLGRIVHKLKELGQLDETLIVLTADHGATHGANFYGQNTPGGGLTNWYYGESQNDVPYLNPSPALAPLIATGNVQFSYQSTGIETWLLDNSRKKKREAAAIMKRLPGVIASYWRHGDHFHLKGTNRMTKSERRWWKKTAADIVATLAAPNGPDVVGLLHDDTSYGVYGDHGGASKEVQRVPMVFWTPGRHHGVSTHGTFRTPDVLPTILRAMGIDLIHPVDGKARPLRKLGGRGPQGRGSRRAPTRALRLALADLVDLVGDEPVRLAVNRVRGLRVRSLDEAEDLPSLLVDPVALVVDAVLRLLLQVLHVRVGDVLRRHAALEVVNVHVERHAASFVGSTILRTRRRLGNSFVTNGAWHRIEQLRAGHVPEHAASCPTRP